MRKSTSLITAMSMALVVNFTIPPDFSEAKSYGRSSSSRISVRSTSRSSSGSFFGKSSSSSSKSSFTKKKTTFGKSSVPVAGKVTGGKVTGGRKGRGSSIGGTRVTAKQKVAKAKKSHQQVTNKFKGTPVTGSTLPSQGKTQRVDYGKMYKSNPVYQAGSRYNKTTYYDRRQNTFGDYEPPTAVYNSMPSSFGMWDTLAFMAVIDAMSPDSPQYQDTVSLMHNQQQDAELQAMRTQLNALSGDPTVGPKIAAFNAQVDAMAGKPIDPNFVPTKLDSDLLMTESVAASAAPKLRLCTGGRDGVYYYAGNVLRNTVVNADIIIVETAGTVDNLLKLSRGECDAAFIQRDALNLSKICTTDAGKEKCSKVGLDGLTLNLMRVMSPYKEYAHLVCKKNLGYEITDFEGDDIKVAYPKGSGAGITLGSWIAEDSGYASFIPIDATTNTEAILKVVNGQADCALMIAGIGAKAIRTAGSLGKDTLQLVEVDDWDFNDTVDPEGQLVYQFENIESGTYKVQNGSSVETIAVGVDVVINDSWAKSHAKEFSYLLGDLADAETQVYQYAMQKAGKL